MKVIQFHQYHVDVEVDLEDKTIVIRYSLSQKLDLCIPHLLEKVGKTVDDIDWVMSYDGSHCKSWIHFIDDYLHEMSKIDNAANYHLRVDVPDIHFLAWPDGQKSLAHDLVFVGKRSEDIVPWWLQQNDFNDIKFIEMPQPKVDYSQEWSPLVQGVSFLGAGPINGKILN